MEDVCVCIVHSDKTATVTLFEAQDNKFPWPSLDDPGTKSKDDNQ